MRQTYLLFPQISVTRPLSRRAQIASKELQEQKLINAELLRVCEHQRRLLTEQSSMIEEILEGMGR